MQLHCYNAIAILTIQAQSLSLCFVNDLNTGAELGGPKRFSHALLINYTIVYGPIQYCNIAIRIF